MKLKLMLPMLVVVMMVIGGCSGVKPSASLLSGTNINRVDDLDNGDSETAEYIGRLGAHFSNLGVEAGIDSHWFESDETKAQSFGVYVLKDLIPEPNELTLLGQPYVGANTTLGVKSEGDLTAFIVGTKHEIRGVTILTEFQLRTYNDFLKQLYGEKVDRYKFFIGPSIQF